MTPTDLVFGSPSGAAEMLPLPLPRPTESLLHLSIAGGHLEILKLLLQHVEISIDEKDSAGFTPLQRAVISGREDMVVILLEYGADVNGGDNSRSKPEGIF
jgi:ankyrin repeat protein